MGDPELRSDEKVLIRTPGVYVKAIPFEGILTNRRIILIDRAKNLLPPKEIPLVTIREVEPGENAIRDQIITLSVMARTGETRQMILTFSRQAGGNRIKERDAWARMIKENASSSFDQVIRNVIPGPEPAPRRTELAAGPKYQVVPTPVQLPAAPYHDNPPAETAIDGMNPVRRPGTTAPVSTLPHAPAPVPSDASSALTGIFCSKCGFRIPAQSVFCNRCGSPVTRIPAVSSPVQPPAAPPVVKAHSSRPIDEEIHSIEPLIEPSTVRIPPDPLRAAPMEHSQRQSRSWEVAEKPATPPSVTEIPLPAGQPSGKDSVPRIFPEQSGTAPAPAPAPSPGSSGDTPPPPKPPRSSSIMPGSKTILTAAVALFVILLVAAGAFFVLPMLTSETAPPNTDDITPTPTLASQTLLPSGTIVIRETPAPVIPSTGVYVHVNYLGGFKGSYGLMEAITTVPGNSGDRVWEVENASGTVQATFEKLDGSSHELLVEIYKDGRALTSGTTTVGHGSVALSVNTISEIAAAPVTSGGSSTAKTATAAPAPAVNTTV
jgi:hypothetical protein